MTDFSLLLPNIFDDNTRADKERMKRMILRLQNLQSFYYYHSEKSFVSVSFHPLSIHPCFVTKQRWAQFCVKDVKGEKRLENLWPKCPPTKPPTSHFVHVEIQRYHLLEGFETRTWAIAACQDSDYSISIRLISWRTFWILFHFDCVYGAALATWIYNVYY